MINRILSFLLFFVMIFIGCETKESADIILIIPAYTMTADQPWAEAVVIKNNKILFVGDKKEALLFKNSLTRLINNPNGMVLPGFIDSHVHLLWGGIEMSECQLNDLETEEQIFQAIQDYIHLYPDNKWIRGSGWALPIFPNGNPRKEWLDKISTNKPVYLLSADGHSAWVNSKALALAGINAKTNDPPNGIIERDPQTKEPSGVLREDAMELVYSLFPSYTQDELDNGLQVAIKEASRFGITSILDAGTEIYPSKRYVSDTYDGLDSYRKATSEKNISLRVAASLYAHPNSWREDLAQIKKRKFENEFGMMNTVKIFTDGVIEGGTAALIEPYLGTKYYGILNWNADTLNNAVAEFEKAGFQVHVHATGDRGIQKTLDAFEYAQTQNGLSDSRPMITHVQLVHPDDIARFGKLNVIASFQALWAYPDQYIKELTLPVLGVIRSNWNYPINSIVSSGGRIAGGSDWTVSSLNPLYAIEVAITRREPGSSKYGDALIPEEAVDLETILHAYTLEGAYSIFKENEIGSLETGKLADIVILDRNLFQIPKNEIHKALVDLTIFDGKIVYERE